MVMAQSTAPARAFTRFRPARFAAVVAALSLGGACQKSKAPSPSSSATFAPTVPLAISSGQAVAEAKVTAAGTGKISEAIRSSKSVPTGYGGAEGKVVVKDGTLETTGLIEGRDPGFFVEFEKVAVEKAKYLVLSLKGNISQKQGWDHYASIQLKDENGERFIVLELCKEGKYGSCAGKSITKPSMVRQGTPLKILLPAGIGNVSRFEVVFIGESLVQPGLSIRDIGLESN